MPRLRLVSGCVSERERERERERGREKLRNIILSLPPLHRDKLFPALGFGGKIGDQVSHEFFLNGHPSNPYCNGVQGVVEAYHTALRAVQLWGPTNFAPIIKHVARFAAEAKQNPQTLVRVMNEMYK